MPVKNKCLKRLRNKALRSDDRLMTYTKKTKKEAPKKSDTLSTPQIVKLVLRFAELISGKSMFPYQLRFARRIVTSVLENDGATLTGLFSRQSGKTEVVACTSISSAIILPTLANQPAFRRDPRFNRYWKDRLGNLKYSGLKGGMMVGIYAPVEDQAKIAFNRIREFLVSETTDEILKDVDFNINFDTFNGRAITMKNDKFTSLIAAYSASDGASIEGKTYHLVVCDECVSGDSKITMADGSLKLMKDISIGDRVLGYKDDLYVEEIVKNKWDRGYKDVYKITTDSGRTLKATNNHKFYTNHGWISVDQLRNNYLSGDTTLLYINDTQDEKDSKRVPFRNIIRRCLDTIRGQKIFSLPKSANKPFLEAISLFKTQAGNIRRFQITQKMSYMLEKFFNFQKDCCVVWRSGVQKREQEKVRPTSYRLKKERLTSVTLEPKKEETFDIETPLTHSFIANGIVVHNSQDISDFKISKSIVPFLAYNNGTLVEIGTPGLHKGRFYQTIQSNKRIEREHNIKNHYEYDYLYVQRHNPQYKKFVSQRITELGGIDNDEFRMNFLLEWMLDRGMFIEEPVLQGCGKDYDIGTFGTGGYIVAGIDWAKKLDSTVMTIIEVDKNYKDRFGKTTKRVLHWKEFHGVSYQSQISAIVDELHKFNVDLVISDETGVGNMPTEVLKSLRPVRCTVFPLNMTSRQLQTDLWQNLSTDMACGRLFYPASAEAKKDRRYKNFYEQFLDLEKDTTKGYLTCHAPEGKYYHDDYADSLALANYGADYAEDEIIDLDDDDECFDSTPLWR